MVLPAPASTSRGILTYLFLIASAVLFALAACAAGGVITGVSALCFAYGGVSAYVFSLL